MKAEAFLLVVTGSDLQGANSLRELLVVFRS